MIEYGFLLQLLDFINEENRIVNIVPDMNTMNASFRELINSYKRSLTSAERMTFANDRIYLPVKPMNGRNETNNQIKSITEKER